MAYNEKPAVQSVSLWASLLTFIPLVVQEIPNIVEQVTPVLSPHAAAALSAAGGVIVILRRLFSQNKEITSVVIPK